MKQFSHTSTDLKIVSSVALGNKLMTVQIGDLPAADLVHSDFAGIISGVADPEVLVTLLELNNVGVWDIPLDEAGMFDSICNHFLENDFKELADLLEQNKEQLLAMGMQQLAQHWDENLENLLYERAAKSGKIKHARQEKNFELVLRKAHPLRHKKTQHPLAKHFVSHVWPTIHQDMRMELSHA
jgi:hypothetical protein